MKLTGINGKVLSNSLHFDMSLISRWKNGKRKILNEAYLADLAKFFLTYGDGQFRGICSGLINLSLDASDQAIIEGLKIWLSAPMLEEDLYGIGSMSHGEDHTFIHAFVGNEGRRHSVLAFLAMAIRLRSGGTLYLSSSEENSWLMADTTYWNKWTLALEQCIEAGYEIVLIHTVRPTVEDLYRTFIQWLPLYMTGHVSAYYTTDKHFETQEQTLFIVENLLMCEGYLYGENQDHRYTMLTNDPVTVQSRQQLFDRRRHQAKRINYTYDSLNLYKIMGELISAGGNKADSLFKADELVFTSMDKDLLLEVLAVNDVIGRTQSYILDLYDQLNNNFIQNIHLVVNRHIYNLNKLIQQAEEKSFKSVLLSIITGKEVIISREQYMRHLSSTIDRLIKYPNYEIGLYLNQSTQLPLETLDIWVKEGYYMSMWSKASYDFIQMSYEPSMVEAIKRFYQELWDMIPLIEKDKNHVIGHFEKLIIIGKDGQ